MIHLEIDSQFQSLFSADRIRQAAKTTLQESQVEDSSSLTILITGDRQMSSLNTQYRQVHHSTDVLAFPAGYTDPDTNKPYLGDVVISFPRAKIQADSHGHAVESELQLLTVHGVLHLLGYDHLDVDQKRVMWHLQAGILRRLGLEIKLEDEIN